MNLKPTKVHTPAKTNSGNDLLSRRSFLKTALGTALAVGLPGFSITRALGAANNAIREFHFSASQARVNLGVGPDFQAWTYNGQIPGPEVRVKQGEIIRVVLKNYLPEETTIHWHGVPVPNAMDGVPGVTQKGVAPGQTFIYEFVAEPAGSYIYHSHANYQLDQGLYGALIIEDNDSSTYDRDYALLLEDWVSRDGGGVAETRRRPPMGMMMGGMMGMNRIARGGQTPLLEPYYDAYAVNGKSYPQAKPLIVRQGDRVKLRLLNPSSSTIYNLRLAGHSLTVTHLDANPVKPLETDVLRIGMGERYDVEFIANNPGNWLLAAQETGFGEGMLRVPLQYKGIGQREPVPPVFHRGLRFASYWDFQALQPSGKMLSKSPARFYSQTLSGGMMGSPYWTINGFVYPNAERLGVRQGDLVRLSYWNHSMMPHPMHLHGHFFKVVNPALPPYLWIQKDTIIVNPMERLEVQFVADNPGSWFHHCHNLYHMEGGMANVLVYRS
ncbi:MAG: multicopper oxidase family protein [Deltaproteobacteria bacterium]|nr:multicopper oxidase family protein [Deltaproteobacteria bacterium]MBW2072155.1 multicopper oxidase family protein [Deltaproteobacteria bacterium]